MKEDDYMCLFDDYKVEAIFAQNYPFGRPNSNNPVWTTKEGKQIRVSDMTTAHIINCQKMVGEDNSEWYMVFQKELDKREEKQ